MLGRLAGLDANSLRARYVEQGAFLFLPEFLGAEVTAQLVAAVATVTPAINRNYLPGHKQGGSVSRHIIDQLAPFIADLYRSPALIGWLEQLTGEPLQLSPADDPHAYALYFYTRPGDHIGWHYDTSYYAGRRYTLLLGVIEESTASNTNCTRAMRAPRQRPGPCRYRPADWCFSTATDCATGLRRSASGRASGECR
jgi:hypothetical protein